MVAASPNHRLFAPMHDAIIERARTHGLPALLGTNAKPAADEIGRDL